MSNTDDAMNDTPDKLPSQARSLNDILEQEPLPPPSGVASFLVMLLTVIPMFAAAALAMVAGWRVMNGQAGWPFGLGALVCGLLGSAIGKLFKDFER